MRPVRFITWNCRSGSVDVRLAQLNKYGPDVVFLQECAPTELTPCTCRVNARKGIALVGVSRDFELSPLIASVDAGRASVAASFADPDGFSVIGIWGQPPHYVDDVLRTLHAHSATLRQGRAIVMGDFNSGTHLRRRRTVSAGHQKIVKTCSELGLVSAYHAFHRVQHAQEKHATYYHQFKSTQPWHIDYCFVPTAWVNGLMNVQVLTGTSWARHSDHRPLIVDLMPPAYLAMGSPRLSRVTRFAVR
jgi:endonuclease/exonuclease/phosphatase family metal-dependent hydrolase